MFKTGVTVNDVFASIVTFEKAKVVAVQVSAKEVLEADISRVSNRAKEWKVHAEEFTNKLHFTILAFDKSMKRKEDSVY